MKTAVILVTYGEVKEPTIKNLLPNSARILRLLTSIVSKIPKPIEKTIAIFRTIKRKREWTKFNYRSPLNSITEQQREKLQVELEKKKHEVEVFDAYYFTPPYFDTLLRNFGDKFDRFVIVPMIPVESAFSCGLACSMVLKELNSDALTKATVLKHFWNDEKLIEIFKEKIFQYPIPTESNKSGIVLAVHGTITKTNKGHKPKMHTGFTETMTFFQNLKEAIEKDDRNPYAQIKIGALNHRFGGVWMEETVERAFQEMEASQVDHASLFPFGFFADNSETTFEAKSALNQSKVKSKRYIPCVNDDDLFIEWLANRVSQKLA